MGWLGVLLLAYITRGVSRVHTDFTAHPVDMPSYARERSLGTSIVAGLWWWHRQTLWSAAVNLTWTFAILGAGYWLLGLLIGSIPLRLAILALMPLQILVSALLARR